MSDEQQPIPDSSFAGVSVRAWLSILLVSTVCVIEVMRAVMALRQGEALEIAEPLRSLATIAIGFYFGQKNKL